MEVEKPAHIKFTLRSFTADECQSMAEESENWREPRPGVVAQYATAMCDGKWEWGNGEVLIFDEADSLVDGQHRALAAARFMRAKDVDKVWFWCAGGVLRKTQHSMDAGISRKIGEYLKREGVTNPGYVSTILFGEAVGQHHKLTDNVWPMLMGGLNNAPGVAAADRKWSPTTGALMDLWKRNRGAVAEWASISARLSRSRITRAGTIGMIGYHIAKRRETDAKLFMSYLEDGKGIKEGDPVGVLRDRLQEDFMSRRKMSREHVVAFVIKAWNAWVHGERITHLRYQSVGPKAEAFPLIQFENEQ